MDVKGFRAGRASYPTARLESLSHPGHPPECTNNAENPHVLSGTLSYRQLQPIQGPQLGSATLRGSEQSLQLFGGQLAESPAG
jgi:hypothetical protein